MIYVPKVQQRKAQVLAALCILLRYTLLPSGRLALSRALSFPLHTVPGTRGWWSRPTDRPSGGTGGPGLELYYGLRGGIFIAEVTSIHPSIHSPQPRQSGAAALCSALPLPLPSSPSSPSLAIRRAGLPSAFALRPFFFLLHPWDLHLLHRTFSRSPLILPSLSPHNQTISNPGLATSICWVATWSHQAGLDPRPSTLETL